MGLPFPLIVWDSPDVRTIDRQLRQTFYVREIKLVTRIVSIANWRKVDRSSHAKAGDVTRSYWRTQHMNVDEETVRQLATMIWETEGKPEGHHERHWQMATKLAESVAMTPSRGVDRAAVEALLPDQPEPDQSEKPGPERR